MKRVYSLIGLAFWVCTAHAQYDFSASWNVYVTGEVVEEDPFNGSFTIENVGETTIPVGDTIWYGYLLEDSIYDLALTVDFVSGQVLDDPFEPGETINISNLVSGWPFFDTTVEMCATVFGVGYQSYSGVLFTGDEYPEDNSDCVMAVVPGGAVGLNEELSVVDVYFSGNRLFVNGGGDWLKQKNNLTLFNLSGQQVLKFDEIKFHAGTNVLELNNVSPGTYVLVIQNEQKQETFKVNIF